MKLETAKGGDSMVASTIDLIANLLPPRLTKVFRKNLKTPATGTARPHSESRPSHP
ncbi:MAG: hypothetical protein HYV09_11000 [Deltaproteobacteria bacterium]|nr:hypothetical protein [Deltaproteobacteria bacterium]